MNYDSKSKNESEKNTGTKGEDIIAGRNAVNEALRSGRTIDSLYVVRGQKTGSLTALIAKPNRKTLPLKKRMQKIGFYVWKRQPSGCCGSSGNQGIC